MSVVHVSDPKQLATLIREDQERLQMEVRYAIIDAAKVGQRVIRSVVPLDTGALRRETVVAEFPNGFASPVVAEIVEKTPYAAAMEVGTRPFTPPFQAILAWAFRQAPNLGFGDNLKAARAAERDRRLALKWAKMADRAVKRSRAQGGPDVNRGAALGALERKVAANKPIIDFARRVWMSIRKKGIKAKWATRDAQPKLWSIRDRMVRMAVEQHKPVGAR